MMETKRHEDINLERLGLPIPATFPLIAAGILIEMNHMTVIPAFSLAFLSVMLADISWFYLGQYRGHRILTFLCRISLEPDACVRKTANMFTKHGATSLIFVKFIPGLSNLMVALVGIVHMPLRTFLLFDSIGASCWLGVFMSMGYFFSSEIEPENIVLPDWQQGVVVMTLFILLALFMAGKYVYRQYLIRDLFTRRITPKELKTKIDNEEEIAIVDVRHRLEFDADPFMIPGAIYFPLEDLKAFASVSTGREMVTYCS
jgi:membrane protein DedA with SNARE-associated domain